MEMGPLEVQQSDSAAIELLNKEKGWKLKGIVSGTALELLQKYQLALNSHNYRKSTGI